MLMDGDLTRRGEHTHSVKSMGGIGQLKPV